MGELGPVPVYIDTPGDSDSSASLQTLSENHDLNLFIAEPIMRLL